MFHHVHLVAPLDLLIPEQFLLSRCRFKTLCIILKSIAGLKFKIAVSEVEIYDCFVAEINLFHITMSY